MIDLNCKFKVTKGEKCGFPKGVENGMRFRLSLNTGFRKIDCEICYLGEDRIMQPDCWYEGTLYLPYGEAFPPFGNRFSEQIVPGEYGLFYASECVGRCITISLSKFHGEFSFDG